MNLDDFIVGSLEPDPADTETATMASNDPEAAALAPELARTRDVLADEATWVMPSPGVEDWIVNAVAAEAVETDGTAGASSGVTDMDTVGVAAIGSSRRGHGARRSRWWSVVPAAAVAALVVGVVATTSQDGSSPDQVEVALAGTEMAPAARATASLQEAGAGLRVQLDVEGLPPAEPGTYYEAWIVGPRGVVALGTFHLRADRGPHVVLWSGVPAEHGMLVTVTVEPDDGNPSPSTQRVLEGRVGSDDGDRSVASTTTAP